MEEQSRNRVLQDIDKFNKNEGGTIGIYAPGSPDYETLIRHRFGNGIWEVAPYVLVPGSESDLSCIMKSIAANKVRFAVKSGGHISIPKLNLPNGFLISMTKFNQIAYDKDKDTLDVGAGVIWRDVYNYLERLSSHYTLGAVGGDPLVGVSGWLLGGGYSLLTNKYGLGMDNVVGFQVLLPDGAVRNVNREENSDLFKALKGGGHNFGIVIQFTLQIHSRARRHDPVFSFEYPENASSLVKDALVYFILNVTPPEAVALVIFRHDLDLRGDNVTSYVGVSCWYYGEKDLNPFLEFRNIARACEEAGEGRDLARFFFSGDRRETGPDQAHLMSLPDVHEVFALRHLPVSLETLQRTDGLGDSNFVSLKAPYKIAENAFNVGDLIERNLLALPEGGHEIDRNSFTSFKAGDKTVVMESTRDPRGRMACIMVTTFTRNLIDEAEKQARALASMMKAHNGKRISFEIWPFHKDSFNGIKPGDCAWPHEGGKVFGPLIGWFEWSGKENDNFWLTEIQKALDMIHEVARKEECTTNGLPMCLNLTLETTSAEDIYRDNYEYLKNIRAKYDPNNVMGQAAGFIIPLGDKV